MEEYSVIGQRLPLKESAEKVTGSAIYTRDIKLPGMLYARILRSPIAHAKVLRVDTSKAEALPGVKAVISKNNAPRIKVPVTFGGARDKVLFDDKVRYVGDELAAVAATDESIAEEALDQIEVKFEEIKPVFDPEDAMKHGVSLLHEDKNGNIALKMAIQEGDVELGFIEADYLFEETFRTQSQRHVSLEPHCCVADFDMSGNLTVWSSTQLPHFIKELLAEYLDMPISKVRVIKPNIGGGFGGKLDMLVEHTCALLARIAGLPVKIVLTPEEMFASSVARIASIIKTKIGVKRDGSLTAMDFHVIDNVGAYLYKSGTMAVRLNALIRSYKCPNVNFEGYGVYTNIACAGAMRGYGAPQAFFALESIMDAVAERLDIDPVELRLKNFRGVGDEAMSGKPLKTCGLPECLTKGAELIEWSQRNKSKQSENKIKRGLGVACFTHLIGPRPGKIRDNSTAFVKLNTDGTVHLIAGGADLGTGSNTTLAQIVAEVLGVKIDDIEVTAGDTGSAQFDSGAFASRTLYMCGLAAREAAADAKQQLLTFASEKLDIPVELLEMKNRSVYSRVNPENKLLLKDITSEASERVDGKVQTFLGKASCGNSGYGQSFGAEFAEVAVNIETGTVKVIKIVAALDVGKAINPMIVEGQIEGAVQMGLGFALTENPVLTKREGQTVNCNFAEYMLPTSLDMPEIDVVLIETDEPSGPFGAKGVGEPPVLGIAPAVANAIYNATGARLTKLPMTPDGVLESAPGK